MAYIEGMVAAVPTANKEKFIAHSREATKLMKEFGVLKVTDCWGDDVPDGEVTSFIKAVGKKDDETVVFSWLVWPDKATRDAGMEKMMTDERMAALEMPFDGQRMIFGGFVPIFEA